MTTETWSVYVPPLGVNITGIVLTTNPPAIVVGSLHVRPSLVATALTTVPEFSMTKGIVQTGVWSVGVLPSSVQRMSAPAVEVETATDTGPSKEPPLGRMVGAAAFMTNKLDDETMLGSNLDLIAIAFTIIFVDVTEMGPLYKGESDDGVLPSRE